MVKTKGCNKYKVNNSSNNILHLPKTINSKCLHNTTNLNKISNNNNLEESQQFKITIQLLHHQAKMQINSHSRIIMQLQFYQLINNNNHYMEDKAIIYIINPISKEIKWLPQHILSSNKQIIINSLLQVGPVLNSTDIIITSDL